MTPGQSQWRATDSTAEFTEGDDRTRERHSTDKNAEVGFDVMNCQLDAHKVHGRIHEVGETNGNGGKTNKTVKYRDEFGHLRHLHTTRQQNTYTATNQERNEQDRVVLRDDAENRRELCYLQADNAVPVTASCGLLVRQAAEGQDEKYRRGDIRDGNYASADHIDLTCGTFRACGV